MKTNNRNAFCPLLACLVMLASACSNASSGNAKDEKSEAISTTTVVGPSTTQELSSSDGGDNSDVVLSQLDPAELIANTCDEVSAKGYESDADYLADLPAPTKKGGGKWVAEVGDSEGVVATSHLYEAATDIRRGGAVALAYHAHGNNPSFVFGVTVNGAGYDYDAHVERLQSDDSFMKESCVITLTEVSNAQLDDQTFVNDYGPSTESTYNGLFYWPKDGDPQGSVRWVCEVPVSERGLNSIQYARSTSSESGDDSDSASIEFEYRLRVYIQFGACPAGGITYDGDGIEVFISDIEDLPLGEGDGGGEGALPVSTGSDGTEDGVIEPSTEGPPITMVPSEDGPEVTVTPGPTGPTTPGGSGDGDCTNNPQAEGCEGDGNGNGGNCADNSNAEGCEPGPGPGDNGICNNANADNEGDAGDCVFTICEFHTDRAGEFVAGMPCNSERPVVSTTTSTTQQPTTTTTSGGPTTTSRPAKGPDPTMPVTTVCTPEEVRMLPECS